MNLQDFADEIERARTMLQTYYRSVTVSASMAVGIPSKSIFISVKTPQWEQDMEWREGDAPNMPLSMWIYRMVRLSHAPDIAKAAHSGEEKQ